MINPEFDFSFFFTSTPDLVCIAGKDGFFRNVNPAVINKLGFSKEELFERPISSFIHEDDKAVTHKNRQELLQGKTLFNFINRYVTKSGGYVWLEWTSIYFADKEIVFAIAKDITERKNAEIETAKKYIKYKGLANHFKHSIENDRKNLAYELHEDLAQLVSALKMDIDWISLNVPELSPISRNRVDDAMTISKLLISTIQRLAFSISPNMIDNLGLHATLEWLCKEFTVLHGIPCSFESDYNEAFLTDEMKIDFFRLCQESLSSVLDHASATNIKISIEEVGQHLQLVIMDDGRGFDMTEQKTNSNLAGMKKRAASINGSLTFANDESDGTGIFVTLVNEYPHGN